LRKPPHGREGKEKAREEKGAGREGCKGSD